MTYFVSMTDKFMSGWGAAQKKVSKYVVECDTLDQAEHISNVARNQRNEMAYINITTKAPKFYPLRKYHISQKHWDELGGVWKKGLSEPT